MSGDGTALPGRGGSSGGYRGLGMNHGFTGIQSKWRLTERFDTGSKNIKSYYIFKKLGLYVATYL